MSGPPYVQHSDGSIREGRTVTPADVPPVAVEERDLSFIRVDHQVRLQFGGTEIVIESPFALVIERIEHRLDPGQREHLGPLLAMYPDVLRELVIGRDGTLRVDLDSGASLSVPPDPNYEAWQISGPGKRLIVCGPGGSRLSLWA